MTDISVRKLVVFDCDGTLVDSQHNIITCMTESFQAHGLAAPSDRDIRSSIGLNLETAIHRLLPDQEDLDLLNKVVLAYKEAFFQQRLHPDHEEPLYPGALAVLEKLSSVGCLMAVATGKSSRGLNAVVEQHSLQEYFISLQTPDNNPGKPHPQMLERAMEDAGAGPENTYMVGDTSFDMMLAKNAGCHAVGVSWGYHELKELSDSGADHLIEDFAELTALIFSK
ncbi:MAG: HAD family hydrolase [Proteobacteria bacterium]|nr:HAD family hydrolase [Pseudomonadota bacterium]